MPPITVTDLIDPASILWLNETGSLVLSLNTDGRGYTNSEITDDVLRGFHPQLPLSLRALLRHLASISPNNRGWLYGEDVDYNLDYLHGNGFTVRDPLGTQQYIKSLSGIGYSHDGVTVFLNGLAGSIRYIELGDARHTCVQRNPVDMIALPKSDLDAKYPGWESRYSALKELGIDESAVLTSIFAPTKIVAVDSAGITFD